MTQQPEAPGEYIVVTIIVGTQGKLQLPVINSTEDLRRSLSQMGSISSEQLLAVEVLWTPQASGDTLSSDDMIAEYPDIKLIQLIQLIQLICNLLHSYFFKGGEYLFLRFDLMTKIADVYGVGNQSQNMFLAAKKISIGYLIGLIG